MAKDEGNGSNWGAAVGAAISTAGNIGAGSVASRKEYFNRKKLMNMAYEKDLANWRLQNEYNHPYAQKRRLIDAGLNPALMYGSGSASTGNSSDYPKAPQIQPQELMSVYGNVGTNFMDMLSTIKLKNSQADLNIQKKDESGTKAQLNKTQAAVAAANPYLDKRYLDSVVQIMVNTAELKQSERNQLLSSDTPDAARTDPNGRSVHQQMINAQLQNLLSKYQLDQADQKLKAEILKSQGFKNDLQKIQVDWMQSGDVTPQHIYQGILLLLSKMM